MLLTIDIGNTNTVLGVFDGEKLDRSWRIKTDSRTTADELALTFRGLLADHEITGISACSIAQAFFAPSSGSTQTESTQSLPIAIKAIASTAPMTL